MEKLQAAIEQAREKRQEQARFSPPKGGARTRTSAVTEAWTALTPLREDTTAYKHRNRLVALGGGREAAPYDMLRTKILQLMKTHGWRRLAITSPSAGCGKTTTTANLAACFGRQVDLNTIVMDMDMRRPALANLFHEQGEHSVADVLQGFADFSTQARRLGNNVALAMNYKPYRDPAELFLRRRTGEILDEIEAVYRPDLMIFDMPPILANDDTAAFLKNVDCVLVVAEAEVTTIDQIDVSEKEIAGHTNVLGVVLNKCRLDSDAYGYKDYY